MRFVPEKWSVREKDVEWAMKEFNITKKEVERQIGEMRDYEFRRHYTDFNRVFRNWIKTADRLNKLHRERSYRKPAQITAEERAQDSAKSWAELNRYKGMKDG